MSTLSVPLTPQLEAFIDSMVESGRYSNKAIVVRQALKKMSEDEAVEAVLRSIQEAKEGKVFRGDLREIMKQID
mgnify:CR=1 FL=1